MAGSAVPDARSDSQVQQRSQQRPLRQCRLAPASTRNTHFKPFRSRLDYSIITSTCIMLEQCGFYWGPMTADVACAKLEAEPLGTFLIRDSQHKNFFFTVSVQTADGPISIRIEYLQEHFKLHGSKESFDSIFKLIEHYMASPKKLLIKPLRSTRLQPLQELCRKRIVETFGRENLGNIPLNPVLKDYLNCFPYRI